MSRRTVMKFQPKGDGVKRVAHHLNTRGFFFLLIGVLYVILGLAYIDPPPPVVAQLSYIHAVVPVHYLGWGWIAGGLLVLSSAVRTSTRRDLFGFLVAEAWPTVWAGIWVGAWVYGTAPRGWLTAAVFVPFSLLPPLFSATVSASRLVDALDPEVPA